MPSDDHDHLWLRIRTELREAVSESTWHLWLEGLALASIDGSVLTLHAPEGSREWIAARYTRLLQACAAGVLGPEAQVHVADAPATPSPSTTPGRPAATAPPTPTSHHDEAGAEPATTAARAERLNPRLTFDQFVIGDSNRLAHAAALAVAELPALAYNPLFICGPPGLGKTHLLQSIALYVTTYGEGLTVRYTTGEAFTDAFISATRGSGMDAFKHAYRGVDVLLVDDVQFLQAKLKTEEEFFHTFNALHAAGAQIVLTSDRPPRDMDRLEDRLRERFEAGLVTEVRTPDFGTRLTILRKRVQQDRIAGADMAALELIAERVDQNIRALEGALIRVVAFGSLTGRRVDAALAEEVLSGLYPELRTPRKHTLEEIQRRTCAAFSVSLDDLVSPTRAAQPTLARQVAMYLARELTDHTLPAIGRAFGGRNHTTVMHAVRRTAERIAADPEAYAAVDRLTRELRGDAADRSA